jgi:predicted nucleic acid-binding protein
VELIDSSAWIEFLRRTGSRANVEVRDLLRQHPGDVAMTEPVAMELLAGATSDRAFEQIDKLSRGLRMLSVDASVDYRDAAIAYRAVRRSGHPVRETIGCLIAAVAVRTGATLVHRDRDFDLLAAALPDLRVRSLV